MNSIKYLIIPGTFINKTIRKDEVNEHINQDRE